MFIPQSLTAWIKDSRHRLPWLLPPQSRWLSSEVEDGLSHFPPQKADPLDQRSVGRDSTHLIAGQTVPVLWAGRAHSPRLSIQNSSRAPKSGNALPTMGLAVPS
ncbi:hypothetical protein KIL84_006221 [Mauremys mutica]|uniref:Uncharacterized protein n=1 Tax=Mauremys mutica TaxID=74926 RepID=A0A9D3X0B2_9SAUR|nr:hypothetical protein KIL84_006221 [Mauremys mutica]